MRTSLLSHADSLQPLLRGCDTLHCRVALEHFLRLLIAVGSHLPQSASFFICSLTVPLGDRGTSPRQVLSVSVVVMRVPRAVVQWPPEPFTEGRWFFCRLYSCVFIFSFGRYIPFVTFLISVMQAKKPWEGRVVWLTV